MQYVPVKKPKPSQAANRVTGSRVLTSTEGLAILKEREDKKQREAEEKEKRRLQREEKKKERELEREEKKKEKEVLAKNKAEQQLKKAEERKNRAKTAAVQSRRQRTTRSSTSASLPSTSTAPPPTSTALPSTSVHGESPPPPSAIVSAPEMQSVNTSECCECLQSYAEDVRLGTGAEWVECACGRWLHEDCIDSVVCATDGKEKLCSFCVI